MVDTTVYILNSTDNTTQFAIQPRTFDGFGGVQQNTDLTLYGNATPRWGERFNENFYKLLENFAVHQKEPADPGFTLGVVEPKAEDSFQFGSLTQMLGTGFGINFPLPGQLWFNKFDEHIYKFDGTNWIRFATNDDITTLTNTKVNRAGDTMTGLLILSGNPVVPLGAATKQYVDNKFVELSGDTMTGNLIMSAGTDVILPDLPTIGTDAANKQYVDDTTLSVSGDVMTGGFLTLFQPPVASLHAANKQYVDDAIIAASISTTPVVLQGLTLQPATTPNPLIATISEENTTTNAFNATATIPSVPPNTEFILVSIRFNVNIDQNVTVTTLTRQFVGSGSFITRMTMDPIPGISSSSFEAEDHGTFILPFNTATNQYQIRAEKSSSGAEWDVNVRHTLLGYLTRETTAAFNQAVADPLYVNVSGDTMSGQLAMSNQRITSLGTPTISTDAATKGYVDSQIAAITGTVTMLTTAIVLFQGLVPPSVFVDATAFVPAGATAIIVQILADTSAASTLDVLYSATTLRVSNSAHFMQPEYIIKGKTLTLSVGSGLFQHKVTLVGYIL